MSSLRERILDTARRGELHHAIILHGPDHEEMRDFATGIAKTLNCLERSSGDSCRACTKIERGIHPDVHRIEIEENRKMISIEQIRSMILEAGLKPFEGRSKVFIVDPADAMSVSGANALLKTLEEPVPGTIFVLLTRSADRLLPTIRSRSQSISVRPPVPESADQIVARSGVSLQEARLRAVARSAEEAGTAVEFGREAIEQLERAAVGETAALLTLASLTAQSSDPSRMVGLLATVLRDAATLEPTETMDHERIEVIRQAFGSRALLDVATAVLEAGTRMVVNADPRLLVEGALLRLAHRART